ncbi:RNA-binding protein [Saccharobesus litoralis]|uniref:RNA-binding protein n=1 Tax=Saccharobesus litoralis TaxID=2172099 RepID=A0A2S0VMY7_9ALTE|nr:CRTAC1 family protein [Saccharobesus litoralis]AWB65566.1 RNA-binding protein [Saccharobesus litoralis]
MTKHALGFIVRKKQQPHFSLSNSLPTLLVSLPLLLSACGGISKQNVESKPSTIQFTDISEQVGLNTELAWKYGGPAVADINNDGHYDFGLTNHNKTPVKVFMDKGNGTYHQVPKVFRRTDLHGITFGDYDLDGDGDLLLSVGGGSGTKPKPPRLLRNDQGKFTDVTKQSGISEMGARGRSVRWIDLDWDGDLDLMQINAEKMITEDVPRNILFENIGNGQFRYRANKDFEDMRAERVLLTDFNLDGKLDLIAFEQRGAFSVWQGTQAFSFKNVSTQFLPKNTNFSQVLAAAHFDLDNDGDYDYYLSRGKDHYLMANNSLSFDKKSGRLDIRDQGSASHDGLSLQTDGDITLTDFWHWKRGKNMEYMPVFIGKNKTKLKPPSEPLTVSPEQAAGFPDELDKNGWYLGYLGNGQWRFEWKLFNADAWGIRAAFLNIKDYESDWPREEPNLQDILLRNDGDKFVDVSHMLPKQTQHNNWGVAPGDFDNNGTTDLIVYRFGQLELRLNDLILLNNHGQNFTLVTKHGATTEAGTKSHGDMGTTFDYNLDGKIDILSGDDDYGKWHLYRNDSINEHNHSLVRVGYSPKGTDPYGAMIKIQAGDLQQFHLVGSTSASHSQSLLNIAHFGLANHTKIDQISVKWRDGSTKKLTNLPANQLIAIGRINSPE